MPKQSRSTETVRRIVEAAAHTLEKAGFSGFTTNAVAERAGVSIGSLYQYFPKKEALVGALIVRETSRLIDDADAAAADSTGVAGLRVLIRAAVAHQFRRPALARLLDFEEARLPLDADTRRVGDRFRGIVAELLSRPDLPPRADVDTTARDLMAVIKGIIDAAGVHGETNQLDVSTRVDRAVFGYLGVPLK